MAKKSPAPKLPTKPKELKDADLDKAAGGTDGNRGKVRGPRP